MSYQLEIQLKQQSPLLHFQSDQTEATLRASEVKPKLDKFMYKKLCSNTKIDKETWNKWTLKQSNDDTSSGSPAFNYKMRIFKEGNTIIYDTPKMPKIYYGNMGDESSPYAYCIKADCKIVIMCFIPELLQLIKETVEEFFVVTNFGRMSGKGFGSYIVDSINSEKASNWSPDRIIDTLCKESGSKYCYIMSHYTQENVWFREYTDSKGNIKFKNVIFDDIQKLYQVMKSGYNINKDYQRSFLFEYFHQNRLGNIGNEKAYIKQKRLTPRENGEPVKHPGKSIKISEKHSDDPKYVRALLGLSEHMEYITGFEYLGKGKYKAKKDKAIIRIEHDFAADDMKKEDKIERISSPIYFKIINNTVYIVANRIDDWLFGKTFTFEGNDKTESLNIPKSFDVDDFLEFFFDEYQKACKKKDSREYDPGYKIKGNFTKRRPQHV